MSVPLPKQKFQDWFTQLWVILWGRKIDPDKFPWLIGPFGQVDGIGEKFIEQLTQAENLTIERNTKEKGLLPSIGTLELSQNDLSRLSADVIRFYEKTADYDLRFRVRWNPFFKVFGYLVNRLFSQRINQLNIPTANHRNAKDLTSEIIQLTDPANGEARYVIWLRKFRSTGKVVYSGIYGSCRLPSGMTCIRAQFPLPNGNATVIMKPGVGAKGELILDSSGKRFGDAGFYFLLKDAKGNSRALFHSSFTDQLIVSITKQGLEAVQVLRLWNLQVARFDYLIDKRQQL